MMMNIKCLLLFVLLFSMAGVTAYSQKPVNYDENISRIVSKIRQYPKRTKDLDELKQNYLQANKADLDLIQALRASGQPDIWYDVYLTYEKLDNRQKFVMTIPEKSFLSMGISKTDYQNDLKESKYRATAYYYAHAVKLLEESGAEYARQAYDDLVKVAAMNGSFRDIDKLIRKAILAGATNVLTELHNNTGKVISNAMLNQLSVIIWDLKRARYGQAKPDTVDNSWPFTLRVILDDMDIGNDQVKNLEYQEERDIYQGETVVDTIRCLISETRQFKKALLSGRLEYYDPRMGQVINSVPIKVETVFSNEYATLQGDPAAAGEDTRKLLESKKAAYPSNDQMIMTATEEFVKKAKEVLLAE
jgi:hypothetical protein